MKIWINLIGSTNIVYESNIKRIRRIARKMTTNQDKENYDGALLVFFGDADAGCESKGLNESDVCISFGKTD